MICDLRCAICDLRFGNGYHFSAEHIENLDGFHSPLSTLHSPLSTLHSQLSTLNSQLSTLNSQLSCRRVRIEGDFGTFVVFRFGGGGVDESGDDGMFRCYVGEGVGAGCHGGDGGFADGVDGAAGGADGGGDHVVLLLELPDDGMGSHDIF